MPGTCILRRLHCEASSKKGRRVGTNTLKIKELAQPRQWRITIKSNDEVAIDFSEPFAGNAKEANKRAQLMWARTSYVVNSQIHRDVYAMLEVWDPGANAYRKAWEHRGKLPRGSKAPSAS